MDVYFRRLGSADSTGRDKEGAGKEAVEDAGGWEVDTEVRSQNTGRKRRGEGATIRERGERECRKGGGRVEKAERRNEWR